MEELGAQENLSSHQPWEIYDRLLQGIPRQAIAAACLAGSTWTMVRSLGIGMAMTYRGGVQEKHPGFPLTGRPLVELAQGVKSWDLRLASLGLAAINAYYNCPGKIEEWVSAPIETLRSQGAFTSTLAEIKGKKVAVIGHFPGLQPMRESCELVILERNPQEGDLPDFAAEYLLPEQDYVFITGTALINKTLPRLLELSRQAKVVLVGPSVPLVPWWFEYGVDLLAGTVVMDEERAWQACMEGAHQEVFRSGAWMIDISRERLVSGERLDLTCRRRC